MIFFCLQHLLMKTTTETKLNLAEKLRQNWHSQYPYLYQSKQEPRIFHPNVLRYHNKTVNDVVLNSHGDVIDDSLTNLNWLQNLNFFALPQSQPPLSPPPVQQYVVQNISTKSHISHINRAVPPMFESSSIYAEVAMNLEFMKDEASVHFFKVNNQLRPPFSDINLISMAIYSYNKPKVSFPEICSWIEDTFPYYKHVPTNWKTGIKNHLTLSKCFQKVPRRKDENEKGGFWRFSTEFLQYIDKNTSLNKLQVADENEPAIMKLNISEQPQFSYAFGKIINRKRHFPQNFSNDNNKNSAFKLPKKRIFNQDVECGTNLMSLNGTSPSILNQNEISSLGNKMNSFVLKYEATRESDYSNMAAINQVTFQNENSLPNIDLSLLSNSDLSQLQTINSQPKFSGSIAPHGTHCSDIPHFSNDTLSICPEQLTEEEFLSGKAFSNNFLSTQVTSEHISTLLDSHITDFNINDLSITGVGIKPPDWWNQSLSSSQISISKLGCSLRSLVSAYNSERFSPVLNFGIDEEHHNSWPSEQNLEELDILFGLS